MKKSSLLMYGVVGLIVIVIISIIFVILLIFNNNKSTGNSDNTSINQEQKIEYNEDGTMKITDLCSLFTLEIAEKVLNADLVRDNNGDMNACTYKTADSTTGDVSIATMLLTQSTNDDAKQQFDKVKSEAFGKEVEEIVDLDADSAYWSNTYFMLNVLKGNKTIKISTLTVKNPDSKSLSIQIAKLILQKF